MGKGTLGTGPVSILTSCILYNVISNGIREGLRGANMSSAPQCKRGTEGIKFQCLFCHMPWDWLVGRGSRVPGHNRL